MNQIKKNPDHIAIIMDGNGRWAKSRKLKRFQGHAAGVETVRTVIEECSRLEIQNLTLYAFSSENWHRPKIEVAFLMKLLKNYLKKEKKTFQKNNIRFQTIGNIEKLSSSIQDIIQDMVVSTKKNTGTILRLALSYGGRNEILESTRKIAKMVKEGLIQIEEISEDLFKQNLYDPFMKDPDLIIRTSGEFRLSNFLLWQSSYSEFWVTDVFWPSFTVEHLHQAINDYKNRERRFGKVLTRENSKS